MSVGYDKLLFYEV